MNTAHALLKETQELLLGYIEAEEKRGAMMNYTRSVVSKTRRYLAVMGEPEPQHMTKAYESLGIPRP